MKQTIFLCFALLIAFEMRGQEMVFTQPEKLPGIINSDAEESMPLLSQDGRTLFFTRFMHDENVGGKHSGPDVWISKFDGTNWSKPDNTLPFNTKHNEAVIGISAYGTMVYVLTASSSRKLNGIQFSKYVNGTWTAPELIPVDGIDHQGFVGFYVSPDFDVILISMKGEDSKGEEDLYVCIKNASGVWQKPKNLGPTINTNGFEISPFLSADKKRLYFSSNGHQGLGDADIFYSDRLYNSWETWTIPKNLGDKINSKSFEGYFSLYGDSIALVTSNRNSKNADIYKIDVSKPLLVSVADGNTKAFLTEKEITNLLIESSKTQLLFVYDSINLTLIHENQLMDLSKRLSIHRDIKFHIVAIRNANSDLEKYQQRLLKILNFLKKTGIEGSRVTFGSEMDTNKEDGTNEKILIRFYR